MNLATIFVPIGLLVMIISIIAMVIIYSKAFYKKWEYIRGSIYKDEYLHAFESLMDTILPYALLLFVGFIISATFGLFTFEW